MPRGASPNSQKALAKNREKTQFSGERAVKAAIESVKTRRKLKSFRELDAEFTTDEERLAMLEALKVKARHGNLKAFEIYRDTMGMNPKDQTAITTEYADDGLTGALEKAAVKVWSDE